MTACSRTARAAGASSAIGPAARRRAAAHRLRTRARRLRVVRSPSCSPTPAAWVAIEEQAATFAAETEPSLAGDREAAAGAAGKEFVVRLHSYGVDARARRPVVPHLRVATDARRREQYLGLWSKLEYVDMWYSVPQPEDADANRIAALAPRLQRQAPAEGVPLPRRRRRGHGSVRVRARERAGRSLRGRVAVATTRRELPARRRAGEAHSRTRRSERSPAPKGTLLFCNTSGFHRGGFATTRPRVLATVTYSSPASLAVAHRAQLPLHRLARASSMHRRATH